MKQEIEYLKRKVRSLETNHKVINDEITQQQIKLQQVKNIVRKNQSNIKTYITEIEELQNIVEIVQKEVDEIKGEFKNFKEGQEQIISRNNKFKNMFTTFLKKCKN